MAGTIPLREPRLKFYFGVELNLGSPSSHQEDENDEDHPEAHRSLLSAPWLELTARCCTSGPLPYLERKCSQQRPYGSSRLRRQSFTTGEFL